MRKIKILLAMAQWDYNDKKRGLSFQYETLYPAFKSIESLSVKFCDTSHLYSKKIKAQKQQILKQEIDNFKPDQIWFLLSRSDDLEHDFLLELKERRDLITLNWYADDSWRFEDFTKKTCHLFNNAITTDAAAYDKYQKIACSNVFKTQWACSHFKDRFNAPLQYGYQVSFCGQPHTDRREMIQYAEERDILVSTFGYGWQQSWPKLQWNRFRKYFNISVPAFSLGRISLGKMLSLFNTSRINLHFSRNSAGTYAIHARTFEVPGQSGFLLSEYVEGLEEYYDLGEEIEVFRNKEEFIDKLKYYLLHDKERIKIAEKGFQRTVKEHTYHHRINDIIQQIKI